MCIRDSEEGAFGGRFQWVGGHLVVAAGHATARREVDGLACLLYTSDAADERSSVDLGGRRIIKKKKTQSHSDPERRQLLRYRT